MTLLTVKEVCQQLSVSPACVYALVKAGELPSVRIGTGRGTIRVVEEDVKSFVERARQGVAEAKPVDERAGTPSGFSHLDSDKLARAWTEN